MSKNIYNTKTKQYLESQGYVVEKTERWNAFSRTRNDLFGFGDYLAIKPNEIVAVQSTSTSNFSARKKKILGLPSSSQWLAAGGKILLIGWSKNKSNRYEIKTEWIRPAITIAQLQTWGELYRAKNVELTAEDLEPYIRENSNDPDDTDDYYEEGE